VVNVVADAPLPEAVRILAAEKWGSPEAVLTANQRAAVDKEFAQHLKDHHGEVDPQRQRCHIIACVVTGDGATCWYHCV
jgi:hypothetical protein